MNLLSLLLSVGIIGGADGPTATVVSGLPLPAITVAVFGVGFILYVYIAKAITAKKTPTETTEADVPAAPVGALYTGPILTGVEEKEAAVIMAIVSDKTGIPLERLRFEYIKLLEDK